MLLVSRKMIQSLLEKGLAVFKVMNKLPYDKAFPSTLLFTQWNNSMFSYKDLDTKIMHCMIQLA